MITFDSPHHFYHMLEAERMALIGKEFIVNSNVFFPLQLSGEQFNYKKRQGLVFVTSDPQIRKDGVRQMAVSAFSPDDLDIILYFKDISLQDSIIDYIRQMNKIDVTYKGVMSEIQQHFGDGVLESYDD